MGREDKDGQLSRPAWTYLPTSLQQDDGTDVDWQGSSVVVLPKYCRTKERLLDRRTRICSCLVEEKRGVSSIPANPSNMDKSGKLSQSSWNPVRYERQKKNYGKEEYGEVGNVWISW